MPGIHIQNMEDIEEEEEEFMLFPITDIDNNNNSDADDEDDDDEEEPAEKPSFMSLRQRRYSQLGLGNGPLLKLNMERFNQIANQQQKQREEKPQKRSFSKVFSTPNLQFMSYENRRPKQTKVYDEEPPEYARFPPGKRRWLKALRLIRELKDPWEKFHIDNLPVERAIRHRYNALKKAWKQDEVVLKIESDPFNNGAMRECFRLKKTSNFSRKTAKDWKHALNYVAKRYMEDVDRDVYFEDVRLQMDTKLWAEEYNRHNPPKKVDIFQMYVLEMVDRPDKPLYHLEHFIEGDYIKYNSNSGFVEDSLRFTPQAFSHFTFERSGHKLIVVDIQGVGDLWTDPQIHTLDGSDYGDGNLGPRGMALFFHSHVCNSICESLALTKFDLSKSEEEQHEQFIKAQAGKRRGTVARGCETVISPSPHDRRDLTSFLARQRSRTISSSSHISEVSEEDYDTSPRQSEDEPMTPGDSAISMSDQYSEPYSPVIAMETSPFRPRRIRFLSESESDSASASMTECGKYMEDACSFNEEEEDFFATEEDKINFMRAASRGARPSCVSHEINLRNLARFRDRQQEDSVLGMIHHELAKYHEIGRFSAEGAVDTKAALYHEQMAADLGVKEAILTLARLYLGLQHDVLVNIGMEENDDNIIQGVDYMIMAADVGDRGAMIYMAEAFATGYGLGSNRTQSYKEAIRWFKLAIDTTQQDESGEFDATMDHPLYQLQAKVAELYLSGGHGLDKDPSQAGDYYNEAGENAMAAMKGRLANKYYALSEEAYAQVEEE